MDKLIEKLIKDKYLKTPAYIAAFRKIKREDFLSDEQRFEAGINAPLPIGLGQTISQPLTVAFMLEILAPQAGQKILDIGSGSGWSSALLAEIVGKTGKIFAIERIPELKKFGQANADKYNFSNLKFILGDGTEGLSKQAPFDRIQVAAAAKKIPQALLEQLKINGRLVIPTQEEDIRQIDRVSKKEYKEKIYQGFLFVPLIEEK